MSIIPSFRDTTPSGGDTSDPSSPNEEEAARVLAEMLGTAPERGGEGGTK